MIAELAVLKDADGLDRHRIGDLDPRYLRTSAGRSLVESARELVRATSLPGGTDQWTEVRAAASRMGIWT